MSLRSKILVILLAVMVLYVGLDYAVQRVVVFPRFVSLEVEEAKKDVERCLKAIHREIHHLDLLCSDWATWDDTYRFAAEKNPEYIEANLLPETFEVSRLNLIHYYDTEGGLLWGDIRDAKSLDRLTIGYFSKGGLPSSHPLIALNTPNSHKSGIVMTELGPMLVAARPITTTKKEGPIRGALLMGRLLGQDVVDKLNAQTQVRFHLRPVLEDAMPASERELLGRFSFKTPTIVSKDGEDTLNAYSLIYDIHNTPALLIRVDIPREISSKGETVIKAAMISIVVSGLAVLLVLVVLLKRTVLDPMKKLTDHSVQVADTDDLSKRLEMTRSDEIGTLARAIDYMVERLGQHAAELSRLNEELRKDIHKRKMVEEALRESEERYRNLYVNTPGMLHTIDPFGRLVEVSDHWLGVLGYERGEVIGREFTEFLTEESREFAKRAVLPEFFQTGCVNDVPFEFVKRNGEVIDVLLSAVSERDAQGDVIRSLAVVTDITRRKRAEEELKVSYEELRDTQAQLIQSGKLASIGELSSGVAHELNQPLMVIRSNAQILKRELEAEGSKDRELVRHLEMINKNTKRMMNIIAHLKNFSRQSEGELTPLDVNRVIEDSFMMVSEQLRLHNIEVVRDLDPGLPRIMGDANKLGQVILNLTTNGRDAVEEKRKARAEGGSGLQESGDMLEISTRADGRSVEITFRDTGAGISSQGDKEKIFDPFFTTKEVGKGTGLGLSISYGIIKEHQGEIEVAETGPEGTTFRIRLPVA